MAFGRRAEIELAASNRRLKADLRAAEKDLGKFGKNASGKLSSAFKAGLGGFAAFGSIAGIGALGKDVLQFEERLTRIGIQAGASDGELAALRGTIDEVSRSTGITRSEVVGAVDALVNLQGKAGFAADKMTVLARAAQATGSPVQDLAGVAFALDNAFKLQNADDLEGALNAVINAGKSGSVPLNEMSTVLQQIGANFSRVAASGKDGVAELSAAIQVARKGFGSAAEVGTGIKAFVNQLDQSALKLSAYGVRVMEVGKDGRKTLRPMTEILDQIANSRLIKDPTLMSMVFGSAEARQFMNMLIENREEFDKLATEAKQANDVQQDLDRFLQSNAGRIKVAMAEARAELEGLITPERIEKFVGAVEKLVRVLEFVIDNLDKIVMLVGALKVAQLASATNQWARALSGVASSAGTLSGNLGSSVGAVGKLGRGVTGLVGGLGRAASAAGGIAAALLGGYQFGTMLVNELGLFDDPTKAVATPDDPRAVAAGKRVMLEQQEETAQNIRNELDARRETLRRQMAGGSNATWMSPEARKKNEARIAELESQLRHEEGALSRLRAEEVAATVFERDKARGTNAADDVLRDLEAGRVNEALARVGSGFGDGGSVGQSAVIKEFAPELLGLSESERGQAQAMLQRLLAADAAESARKQALEDQVQGTAATDLEAIARAVQDGLQKANIQVAVDGEAVFSTTQNTLSSRRAP